MNQPRFLIHGSIHGITTKTADHLRRFERAGGRVEMSHGQRDAIVSYDGLCDGDGHDDQITIESLIHILERAGASADGAHGVITFGWSHQEPSHLHVRSAKHEPLAGCQPRHSFRDALKFLHLKSRLTKRS